MTDRPNDNLLSRLEQSLRQSRAARMHLAARLRELEVEADAVRAELAEMDTLASQSEAAIYRLLTSVLSSGSLSASGLGGGLPSDAELEAAMRGTPELQIQLSLATAGRKFQRYDQTPRSSAIALSIAPSHRPSTLLLRKRVGRYT